MQPSDDRNELAAVSPQIQERIRASFAKQGLMAHLGARLTHIGPGRVHITLPYRTEITQQDGYIHAGATSGIADSAGGYAALTCFPDQSAVLTVEYKINLIAPARGHHIEAHGIVLKAGRTLTTCRLDVYAVHCNQHEEQRTLVAAGQQTLIRIPSEN